jgi:hypothetical protein
MFSEWPLFWEQVWFFIWIIALGIVVGLAFHFVGNRLLQKVGEFGRH